MPLLQKFPDASLDLPPRRRPRVPRKALLLIVAASLVLWAALILLSIRYL